MMRNRLQDAAWMLSGLAGLVCFCIFIRFLRSGFDAIWDLIGWLT